MAQCPQLAFERLQRHALRVDLLDLPVQQGIDVVAGETRITLEVAQAAHVGQAHAERAAMAHEVELDPVGSP